MSSLFWDVRTVLSSSAQPFPSDGKDPNANALSKLGAVDVWNYLISLSEAEPSSSSSASNTTKLKYFKATDFKQGWEDVPSQIGSGTSYTVEKCTLAQLSSDGSPVVVAVKRLNFFRDSATSSQLSSTALHCSVATVLKELRILTHPPLRFHLNIVSLLGYRSEFTPTDTSIIGSLQCSTDVSLVMEFAPCGTLKDFLASGAGKSYTSGNGPDLLTKARLMHDIASGLEALHACRIAHGDVKVENTLVFHGSYRAFTAKLSDFGHALTGLEKGGNKNQRYLGTPLLNAPEVRPRGDLGADVPLPTDGDAFYKCDLYSYGLLVWELILDGSRFCKALSDIVSSNEGGDQLLLLLDTLPKDELLLRALTSLKNNHGKDEGTMLQMLSRLLQATLRDDPEDRKTTREVVKIFREHKAFRDDDALNTIFSKDKPRPSPLPPATTRGPKPLKQADLVPQMPLVVQEDLAMQLKSICETTAPAADRRSALYDLAMLTFAGFGTEVANHDKAFALLVEAAQLGSLKALAIAFRLHNSLLREVPQSLREISNPIAEIEKNVAHLESQSYFTEHVRQFEQLYQQEALKTRYDIFHKGEPILLGLYLQDAQDHLPEKGDLDLEHLECVSHSEIADGPPICGLLIRIACRLGLFSLIKFLFTLPAPASGKAHVAIVSPARDEDPLIAACRGGHLDVLEFLLSQGAEPTYQHLGTPLHWLMMFPIGEAERALELLLATRGGKISLQLRTPEPGIDMQFYRLCGTPFEFAISINNAQLVELFLNCQFNAKIRDRLTSIGWTDSTFGLAVSLNLSNLLPQLIPLEISYRRSRPSFAAQSRFNRSQGKPEMPPFGLFNIAYPHDPLQPLLIHGASSRTALETSIDLIVQAGICSINDEDANGSTALSQAVCSAPCAFNANIISALISRGAQFGSEETPTGVLANSIAKRRDHAAEVIMKVLLEARLFSLSTELLAAAVQTGNVNIVQAIFSFEDHGKRLDIKTPFIDGEKSVSVLFFALSSPKNAPIIRLLLDHGAGIDTVWEGRTPLEVVISLPDCDAETIDLLISRGAPLFLGGYSIVHCAAISQSRVNDKHVLFHMLAHKSVRALVNSLYTPGLGESGLSPLYMACFAGNSGAVHALLQAGAELQKIGGLPSPLNIAVAVGRRPQNSPGWDGDLGDDEAVYNWRLDMEDIIFALLNEGEPGHGRTKLHIAVQLGNHRRVVELVEQGGLHVFAGDRDKLLPRAYLEDFRTLENSGEKESYIENLKQISEYLMLRVIQEVTSDAENPASIEKYPEDHPASPSDPREEQQAISELQSTLERLRVAREESDSSVGDGLDSPAEREVKISKVLEVQRRTLGDKDLKTLRTMTSLCEILCMLGRIEQAEELQLRVLEGREAQLAEDHDELYEAYTDRISILCMRGKSKEAKDYATRVANKALDVFGMKHPVTLKVSGKLALTDWLLGNLEEAIKTYELTLQVYDELPLDSSHESSGYSLARLGFQSNLTSAYCIVQNFAAASEVAKPLAFSLEHAKQKDFFQIFDILINGLAASLDIHARYDDSELIYTKVIEICMKKHGKRKSHCTRTALERLATHYRLRSMWEKECETLQKLVDVLKSTIGPDHSDTLASMLGLSESFGKQKRWLEAGLLQKQALQSLARSSGADHSEALKVKVALCESLRKQGQLEEAENCGWDAVHGCRSQLGEDHDVTLKAEDELATTLSFGGKSAEAIHLQRRRVDTIVRTCGEMHYKTRQAVENLCAMLLRAKRVDEAGVQAQRCLKISLEIPEANDHVVAQSLYVLATCKQLAGNNDEAVELYVRSIEMVKALNNGKHNGETLCTMRCLGKVYLDLQHYDKAEPVLREILAEASNIFKSEKQQVVQLTTNYLGYVCEVTDRTEEAITHYEAAVGMARRIYTDSGDETIACIHDLVRVYQEVGRLKDAHKLALEVLRYRRQKLGEYHEDTVDAKTDMCFIYSGLGMWPDAECMQKDVLRYLQTKDPGNPETDDTCCMMEAISESCKRQDRFKEAEKFGRSALDYQLRKRGREDVETIKVMINFAYVLFSAGKIPEAERLSSEAFDTCSRIFDVDHEQTVAAQSLRAYAYYKQDHLHEAEKVQRCIIERDPENIEELRFLMELYIKMKLYPEALETGQKALAAAESHSAGEALSNTYIMESMIDLTELYVKMGLWEEAKMMGERALEKIEAWRVPGLYDHVEVYVSALRTLKPVYEALSEERKLLDVELTITAQENDQKERRRKHLSKLELADKKYQSHNKA